MLFSDTQNYSSWLIIYLKVISGVNFWHSKNNTIYKSILYYLNRTISFSNSKSNFIYIFNLNLMKSKSFLKLNENLKCEISALKKFSFLFDFPFQTNWCFSFLNQRKVQLIMIPCWGRIWRFYNDLTHISGLFFSFSLLQFPIVIFTFYIRNKWDLGREFIFP